MDPTLVPHLPALAWLLVASGLVFFMQAGFAAVESGAVRHKNSINVALKNVIDLCCSFAAFFVVGFSLMFGASWDPIGLIGTPRLFLDGVAAANPAGSDVFAVFPMATFLFQATFCSTAATIVSGGVAERCRFMAYVLVSFGVGLVIYPLFGHWVWGGGWLAQLGYHDFAGSSVVHLCGAGVTLAGLQVLGARAGRFGPDGRARRIPMASMPLMALGVLILAFGWVGFNGGSAPLSASTAQIIVCTLLAGCFGALAVMLLIWAMRGIPEADLILNGMLGGLVAVTAGADCVSPAAASVIGLLGGGAVVLGTRLIERWRLDDAVGAVPVHGFAGLCGVVCTALFADNAWLAANQPGGQLRFLLVQVLGAAVCLAWSWGVGWLLWLAVGRLTSLRIGADEEAVGMNYSEHGVDDPLQELAGACARAAAGSTVLIDLDDVREGDLVPLARAVRRLVERQAALAGRNGGWSAELRELRQELASLHDASRREVDASGAGLAEAAQALADTAAFLDSTRSQHPALPVVADLVAQLRRRLDEVAAAVPRAQRALDQSSACTARLDAVAGALVVAGRP